MSTSMSTSTPSLASRLLIEAAIQGQLQEVTRLLAEGADKDATDLCVSAAGSSMLLGLELINFIVYTVLNGSLYHLL
jgi:hypothetical protein